MQWQGAHNAEGKDAVFLHCDILYTAVNPAIGNALFWFTAAHSFSGFRGNSLGWRAYVGIVGEANPVVAGILASPGNMGVADCGTTTSPGRTVLVQVYGFNDTWVSDGSAAANGDGVVSSAGGLGRVGFTTDPTKFRGLIGRTWVTNPAVGTTFAGFIRCM